MFFKFGNGRPRERVLTISNDVAVVSARDRLQNLRMHPGIVIAGKIASGLIQGLRHTKTM